VQEEKMEYEKLRKLFNHWWLKIW